MTFGTWSPTTKFLGAFLPRSLAKSEHEDTHFGAGGPPISGHPDPIS
jgi:hypothetical protein